MKKTPLQEAIEILEREADYTGVPSVSAINRALNILESIEDPDALPFTPGTPEFQMYVSQKVNSLKDIQRIAKRYDVSEDYVLALAKGEDV